MMNFEELYNKSQEDLAEAKKETIETKRELARKSKKYDELLEAHRELIEKGITNTSMLLTWNESMTKTVAYLSIFIFGLVLLYSRPDILILIINTISGR